jgi:hypothetical protein
MAKHANEKFDSATKTWVFDTDGAREDFTRATIGTDNVARWNSNNNVPFSDMLGDWLELGLITSEQMDASVAAREQDTTKLLAEYREQRSNRQLSAEERFELRANFEPGTTVVDVITGQKWKV